MPNFDRLMSANYWEKPVLMAVGFGAAMIVENFGESQSDMNIPNEVYGLVPVLAVSAAGKGRYVGYGAGLHSFTRLVQRTDLINELDQIGTGN